MSILKKIKQEDIPDEFYILSFPEKKKLQEIQNDFDLKKNNYSKEEYLETLKTFLKWYVDYCKNVLGSKSFENDFIISTLFDKNIEPNEDDFLVLNVLLSKQYVEYLLQKIDIDNLINYKHTLSSLITDIEDILIYVEIFLLKNNDGKNIRFTSWRSKKLNVRDIFSAMNELFFIENWKGIDDLYLRDLKPVVMFQMRQLIEIYGQNLVGYFRIKDKNGDDAIGVSQIAWQFIKSEIEKPNSRIILPFNINNILAIYKWTNSFIHTTFLHQSYIQFFILDYLRVLFQNKEGRIKTYDNMWHESSCYSNIKIENYNSLKTDFEELVKKRNRNFSVEWLEIKKVGAYIISL